MAKTLIGNIKGKDGRGISKVEKTATTGVVDTYTITYTDGTKSTYELRNSDDIAIQRQIVPSAAIESSTTATQSYAAGDYAVVNGVLRKVTSSITKGSTIGDSNSKATTVTGELSGVGAEKHIGSGTGTVSGCSVAVEAYAVGKVVTVYAKFVSGHITTPGAGIFYADTSLTLPSGYRPSSNVYLGGYTEMDSSKSEGFLVDASGLVHVYVSTGKAVSGYGFEGIACTFVAKG